MEVGEVIGGWWSWVEVGGGRWRWADLISCNLLDRVVEVSGNICICIFLIIFAKGWKWLHHLQRVCLADDQVTHKRKKPSEEKKQILH